MTKQTKIFVGIIILLLIIIFVLYNEATRPKGAREVTILGQIENSREEQTNQQNTNSQEYQSETSGEEEFYTDSNNQNKSKTINDKLGISNRLNINTEQEPDFEIRKKIGEETRNFVKQHFDSLYEYKVENINPLHPDLIDIQQITGEGKQRLANWFVKRVTELNEIQEFSNAEFFVVYTKRPDNSKYIYGVVVFWGKKTPYQIEKELVEIQEP